MAELLGIVKRGQLRESLEAVRDLLAIRLQEAETKESASVARQLISVLVELDRLPDENRESVTDGFAKQYGSRLPDSEV